ncbi:hypothetical protein DUI87_10107 [Hirundo rustica rustica]|uniref:[histone H3]-lysine(4) N-trimethyltransferase n=1 Tax=Hirundo rustica rustica TaxID=333673 RepID=A0A3M0KHM5_HIRRU|nr:hypothetical protein DUI87_10107 [Hirundo rustica rustica]
MNKVTCNCFTISNGEMQDVGVGLYPSMSLLNHSCDPNCVIVFEGYQLLLHSVREIQIGEELTISYIESLMPTRERQKQLVRQYCFECDCLLCQNQEKRLNVLPKLRGPELDTALKVWSDQCRVQGKNDLPAPGSHTIPDPGQDAIGPLGHLGTLLAHVQLLSPAPPGPFPPGTVQPHRPQPVTLQGVIVAKVQDSALGLIKLHLVRLCPSIQPFQISLQSPPTFQQIDTCSQLSVIRKFTNQRFNTLIHAINKNI